MGTEQLSESDGADASLARLPLLVTKGSAPLQRVPTNIRSLLDLLSRG